MESWEEGVGIKRPRLTYGDLKSEVGVGARGINSEERSPDGEMNPMRNPVVLRKFFEVCDLSDLARFRLVNVQWYTLSLNRWRAEMPLRIGKREVSNGVRNREEHRHGVGMEWKDVSKLYDDNDDSNRLAEKPFRSYRLSNVFFGNPGVSNRPIATRTRSRMRSNCETVEVACFWERCGPSMRHLTLVDPRISCVDSLRKVFFENTPNLESLRLIDFKIETSDTNETDVKLIEEDVQALLVQPNLKTLIIGSSERMELRIHWKHLFQYFPNLEDLGLRCLDTEDIVRLVETLEESILQMKRKINIKSLQLWNCLCEPELKKRILRLNGLNCQYF